MSPEAENFITKKDLTVSILKEILDYNPETGLLSWKISYATSMVKGKVAGTTTKGKKTGYVVIEIAGKAYKAHRLAWAIYYGELPDEKLVIDHKNRVRNDNRIVNLRLLSVRHNSQNKTRKYCLPLFIYKHRDKFAVRITTDKIRNYGTFKTVDEALQKRDELLVELKLKILDAA